MPTLRPTVWLGPRRSCRNIPRSRFSSRRAKPFDAKACAKGKKQLSIPNSSANPFLKGIIDREKKAGAEVGLQVKEWENQGQPSQWVQGMDFAIRDKYDIVDLISGIDPSTIEPQVKAAKAAGVKVMTSHFYDPSDKQNPLVSSFADHRLRRNRQDPRQLGDRSHRRQGQYRRSSSPTKCRRPSRSSPT